MKLTSKTFINKNLFLILTILYGIFILWPTNNFETHLSQGDHGRGLYAFKSTMEGKIPYRDYWWIFGPLMPYYYSSVLHLLGVSIQSVLIGQNILVLLAGVFVFLACCTFLSPIASFIASLWFWAFRGEFFYTYNHIGALCAILATVLFTAQYLKNSESKYIYFGGITIFLLGLIRPNIGLTTLLTFIFCLLVSDTIKKDPEKYKKRKLYALLTLSILIATIVLYWFLLWPLPATERGQCFPYMRSISEYNITPIKFPQTLLLLWSTFYYNISASLSRIIFMLIVVLTSWRFFSRIFRNKIEQAFKINVSLFLFFLSTLTILNLHEFILSGIHYRLNWVTPIIIIIFFILIDIGTKQLLIKAARWFILTGLLLTAFSHIANYHQEIQRAKGDDNLLEIGATRIYAAGQKEWIDTVSRATNYLKQNLPADGRFLALPYDPIYYFLSERNSATRQLAFFKSLRITERQENRILAEIEEAKVDYILISNSSVLDPHYFFFGKAYCQKIGAYIQNNFREVALFGEWSKAPGWNSNHSVKILKRIR